MRKIDPGAHRKIRELRSQGFAYSKIAKMFGVSRQRIHQLCGPEAPRGTAAREEMIRQYVEEAEALVRRYERAFKEIDRTDPPGPRDVSARFFANFLRNTQHAHLLLKYGRGDDVERERAA